MSKATTYLYAVRMLIPNQDPQPIKIGFSSNPEQRRQVYSSGPYPCEWLGVWPGSLLDELAIHSEFHELRKGLVGEWFRPTRRFIRTINKKISTYRRTLRRAEEEAALMRAQERRREVLPLPKTTDECDQTNETVH